MVGPFLALACPALLIALLLSCGIEDLRRREIANAKNAAIALLAPVWWLAIGIDPWPGMAIQLGTAAIVLTIFAAAFAMGQMGGGDVKLIAALSLWLPPFALIQLLVVMSIAGGVLTLAMLADRRLARRTGALEVPYGVAIVFAALLALREPLLNQFA